MAASTRWPATACSLTMRCSRRHRAVCCASSVGCACGVAAELCRWAAQHKAHFMQDPQEKRVEDNENIWPPAPKAQSVQTGETSGVEQSSPWRSASIILGGLMLGLIFIPIIWIAIRFFLPSPLSDGTNVKVLWGAISLAVVAFALLFRRSRSFAVAFALASAVVGLLCYSLMLMPGPPD